MSDETRAVYNGRYELVSRLARGGMAEVYLGRDLLLDRPVALKVLSSELSRDEAFVERFRREAQAAANLSHPNIVNVYDWGEAENSYFIVMEYVPGRTLSQIIKTEGAIEPDRAAALAAAMAAALGFAHRNGVVHRDVKPGNVLITEDDHVKVTDFGIARATRTSAEANLTQTGAVLGTATYFSPEQAEGSSVDARSDIYSLGVVLYEMLCGAPPFQGDNPVSIAYKHVREDPVPIVDRCPACPPALAAIVAKAMAKSPDQRYASADDMRTDLNRFLQGRPVAAVVDPPTQMVAATTVGAPVAPTRVGRAVTVEEETSRPTGGGRGGAYLALLLALLVILGGLIFLLARSLGLIGTTSKVSVPNVIGMNVNQAVSTLTGAGLKATEQFNDAPGTPPNNVYDQNPKPNTSVGSGSSVTLLISKGAPLVAVPNVVGQDVNSASLALQHAGFQVSTTQRADNSQPGTVLSQSPASGQAPQGSTVDLVVSSGAQQVTVPDVSGMTTAQAGNVLGQAGLTVGQSSQQASDSVPSGEVISTNPQAGTSVAKGTAVNLLVSSGPSTTTTTTSSTTTTSTTLLPSSTTTSSTTTTTRPTTTTTAP